MHKKFHIILPLTICFISGILWAENEHNLLGPLCILALLAGFIFFFSQKKKFYIKIITILSLGFFAGNLLYTKQIQEHQTFLNKINNKTFTITGTIKNLKIIENKRRPLYIKLFWEKEKKFIGIYAHNLWKLKRKEKLLVGDKIKLKQISFKTPKNIKYVAYLTKENIATTIFVETLDYKIINRPRYSFYRWLHKNKQNLLYSLKRKMPPKLFALFSSAFLGYKNIHKKTKQNLRNKFRQWGILHILARSGLHLIIFLLLCELLLAFIPIYFFIKQIVIIFLSIIYLLFSWSSISFIRAFSVLILYKISPFLRKKPDLLHIVLLICLLILIANPIQIFFLDFQLSFLLTLVLATFNKIQTINRQKRISENK